MKIGYEFKDSNLLDEALTHSSYANEHKVKSYERLEFLGDSILSFIVSEHLLINFNFPEGELSKARARIVCECALKEATENLDLSNDIKLSRGEEMTGGRTRPSILADIFEAILAAIYLDGGIKPAIKFVFDNLSDIIERGIRGEINRDYKTMLQEVVQNVGKSAKYDIVGEEGYEHNKVFIARLKISGEEIGLGRGRTKKEAEQNAAKTWFDKEKK